MSESKHTPGPWRIRTIDVGRRITPINSGKYIASINQSTGWVEEAEANAARIVQCCNEYDQLKAENERLKQDTTELAEGYNKYFNQKHDLARENKRLKEANSELAEGLQRCLSYLADLNGCEWIKGDGELDMKQRAKGLQRFAYSILAKYNTTKQ